jgi:hypothetical protein
MNAGIGPARSMCHNPTAEQTLQDPLDFDLYRAPYRLPLPSDKAGAVVMKCGKEGPAHGPESSQTYYLEQATQILVTIDKSGSGRVHFFRPD